MSANRRVADLSPTRGAKRVWPGCALSELHDLPEARRCCSTLPSARSCAMCGVFGAMSSRMRLARRRIPVRTSSVIPGRPFAIEHGEDGEGQFRHGLTLFSRGVALPCRSTGPPTSC